MAPGRAGAEHEGIDDGDRDADDPEAAAEGTNRPSAKRRAGCAALQSPTTAKPTGCGWFDSSHALRAGLLVTEHRSADGVPAPRWRWPTGSTCSCAAGARRWPAPCAERSPWRAAQAWRCIAARVYGAARPETRSDSDVTQSCVRDGGAPIGSSRIHATGPRRASRRRRLRRLRAAQRQRAGGGAEREAEHDLADRVAPVCTRDSAIAAASRVAGADRDARPGPRRPPGADARQHRQHDGANIACPEMPV
jgi:hypothetical protein